MRKPGQELPPLLALISGALTALAFPPFRIWPLVLVAPVPLLWALERAARSPDERYAKPAEAPGRRFFLRRKRTSPMGGGQIRTAFLLGWAAAFLHFMIVLDWILALPGEEVTIPGLMFPSLIFISGYLALWFGGAAAVAVWIRRRLPRIPLGLVWATTWVLADMARSAGEVGFPWGSPGYALMPATAVIQFISGTGYWGLVLWINLTGALLYHALATLSPDPDHGSGRRGPHQDAGRSRRARRVGWSAAYIVVLMAAWTHGLVVLSRAPRDRVDGNRGIRVAVIQPNTSRTIKWDPNYRAIVVRDLIDRTIAAADENPRPDLIVWPETAAPIVLLREPVFLQQVEDAVREVGIPVLAGTLDERFEDRTYVAHNSAALFGPDGEIVDRYDKQKLVPFSERMPYQKAIGFLNGLNFGQSDFTPGTRSVIFDVGTARFGCLICFESIFPELGRRFVRAGANMLINITNDFWFGDTAAPVQHADMAVFRAIESRVPLIRCANTGISMIVDPWGRITHRTGTFVEALVTARVAPGDAPSFYVRHGEWVLRWLGALIGAWIVTAAIATAGRRSR
jgi:apolipoprotein N-acyltransferase